VIWVVFGLNPCAYKQSVTKKGQRYANDIYKTVLWDTYIEIEMAGSLASATSTRVDSASKHIVPCKVGTDYMASLCADTSENAMRELQVNKMKYCMHKDDLVIGLGRPMYGSSICNNRKKAYPSVIVTIAPMDKLTRSWVAVNNFMVKDYRDSSFLKEKFLRGILNANGGTADADLNEFSKSLNGISTKTVKHQVNNLLEFYFVGVALGLAYAHPHSGDTVASVMIGGLRTVLNGNFQIHTNDLIMFYWGEEVNLFEENGGRKDRKLMTMDNGNDMSFAKFGKWHANGTEAVVKDNAKDRLNYYARGNGNYKNGVDGPIKGKMHVALIKPYMVSAYMDPVHGGAQHFPMDKFRVFGKAISNAQPFEMVDIMLSRQAI
jgi:hypothetical protein